MSLGAWLAVAVGIGAVIVVAVVAVLDGLVPPSDDWTDGPGE